MTTGRRRTTEELRAEIERTRERLGHDIEQVRAKLSPSGLEHEVRGMLRGAQGAASDRITDLTHAADRQVNELGQRAVGLVRRYPVAATILGLGLAWLAIRNTRREPAPVVRPAAPVAVDRTPTLPPAPR